MPDHIKGRGSSIVTKNRFDAHHFEADEGERVEDQEEIRTKIIDIYPKSIVNNVTSPDVHLSWSMNPYQGCEHGCSYCYARPTHEYWGYNGGLDFERNVLVKRNAAELLREKFQTRTWNAEPIMLSGNTDCYQPIERKLKITRSLLEVCRDYKNPVGIITKNHLVQRDIDILGEMAQSNLAQLVMSITTLDESLRLKLEPRTSSISNRLKTVEMFSKAGIPVSVMMGPVIPALNSMEIMALAERVAGAGAISLHYSIVRLNGCVETVFSDWLERHFADRKQKVMDQIAECHGGDVSDSRFKTRMTGEGNFANIISQQFKLARKKYGLERTPPKLNSKLFVRKNQFTLDL
ncbi:MAG: PA0069 family radical SAM protein [Bacteroidetes bacterium]|nr:PA0069 family radical SAM protein [Bacteroidota bacterium]